MRVRGRPRAWTQDEGNEVMRLVAAGLSYREVCKRLDMSLGMVQRIVSAESGHNVIARGCDVIRG